MKLLRNLYLSSLFFILLSCIIVLFAVSFAFPIIFFPAQVFLLTLFATTVVDVFILFRKLSLLEANRTHAQVLSLGDENQITIQIRNNLNFRTKVKIIDELPEQLQQRDFEISTILDAWQSNKVVHYFIKPNSRGIYKFGNINFFITSPLNLTERRFIVDQQQTIQVFPSIIQMKNFELKTITSISHFQGIKKLRRIGHSYEFEQIKQYISGDDTRSINWKASSRAGQLMVNQYEDERSQPVYSIIDKSRVMRMPFNGLSLLDYAINASLVISNIALRKHDKTGLLTFSDKIGSFIKAEKSNNHLHKIISSLYNEKVSWPEADYELLYSAVRNFIKGRSLLFLFTNFESIYALERVLPLLRRLNNMHLLVVLFFENSELYDFTEEKCFNILEINQQTAAKEIIQQKEHIKQVLIMHGIQAIITKPEELALNTVNKYIELKARGFI